MNTIQPIGRYGVTQQRHHVDAMDAHIEDIQIKGFTVVQSGLDGNSLESWRTALDRLIELQTAAAGGRAALEAIGEADIVRAPLGFDDRFLDLAALPLVMEIVGRLLGQYFILSQQNGIINRSSDLPHHQTAFHRDLPYQHFVSTRPIAINALFCLDPFTPEMGSTVVLPGSHLVADFPSDIYVAQNEYATSAPAGSILILDSMLFHRAGVNRTGHVRRGVNHLYTLPILKQQISLPALLKGKWSDDPKLARFLGYDSEPAGSVEDYRARRRPRGEA